MGGGGKGGGSNAAADTQARLAEQLFTQTDPLRSALIERSATFLGAPSAPRNLDAAIAAQAPPPPRGGAGFSGMISNAMAERRNEAIANPDAHPIPRTGGAPMGFGDVTATPTYAAFRDSTDRTFRQARESTTARLPGGGALLEALAGIEGQKASTLTQGAGQIYENELARALSLATGTAPTALGGLGQAALAQAQAAASEAQQSAAKAGGLGTAVGGIAGMMIGGPAGAQAGAAIGGAAGTAAGS